MNIKIDFAQPIVENENREFFFLAELAPITELNQLYYDINAEVFFKTQYFQGSLVGMTGRRCIAIPYEMSVPSNMAVKYYVAKPVESWERSGGAIIPLFFLILSTIFSINANAQYYYGAETGEIITEGINKNSVIDTKILSLFVGYQYDIGKYQRGNLWAVTESNIKLLEFGTQTTIGIKYKIAQLTFGSNTDVLSDRVFDDDSYRIKLIGKFKLYFSGNWAFGAAYSNKRTYITLYGGQFFP